MLSAPALRARVLTAVASTSLAGASLAVACGGETTTSSSGGSSGASSGGSTSSSGASTSSSSSGASTSSSGSSGEACGAGRTATAQCFPPAGVIRRGSNYGGVYDPDAAPLPPPVLDANGCPVMAEVMDGCCNPAVGAPTRQGDTCCYAFCAGACCGRPLRTERGGAVIAELATRADWASGSAVDVFAIDPITRAALALSWAEDALLEHASIASFAIFAVELLGFGAPAELVAAAQGASLDEVTHARATFAIASAFEGAPLGPGVLPVRSIAPEHDLAVVAAACVRDGCIGETIASLVAQAQAENAQTPEIRAVLARIAEDEARHAELAWRFVSWATARGGEDVRRAVATAFGMPRPAARPLAPGVDVEAWRAAGRLTPAEHDAVVARAEDEVLGPCRDALAIAFVPAHDGARAKQV